MRSFSEENYRNIQSLFTEKTGVPLRKRRAARAAPFVLAAAVLAALLSVTALAADLFSPLAGDDLALGAVYEGDGVVSVHVENRSDKELKFQKQLRLLRWDTSEEIAPKRGAAVCFANTAFAPHTEGVMTLDVHLMITEPEKYIERFCKAGANIVTFHIEATNCPDKCIELIKENGAVPSISVKPNTPVEDIYPFLDKVGMVLVMTVEPGFGGQKFMADCLEKCRKLRDEREKRGLSFMIQTDGGVNRQTIIDCKDAGVDCAVVGSALFGAENREEELKLLQSV